VGTSRRQIQARRRYCSTSRPFTPASAVSARRREFQVNAIENGWKQLDSSLTVDGRCTTALDLRSSAASAFTSSRVYGWPFDEDVVAEVVVRVESRLRQALVGHRHGILLLAQDTAIDDLQVNVGGVDRQGWANVKVKGAPVVQRLQRHHFGEHDLVVLRARGDGSTSSASATDRLEQAIATELQYRLERAPLMAFPAGVLFASFSLICRSRRNPLPRR